MTAAGPSPTIRRLSYLALAVAFAHIVFGAIVRISGSGMGCGDNWPKCYGYWVPPMTRPDLVIEVMHRYLAVALFVAIAALVAAAWRRRSESGVSGRGGVLRAAGFAVALWFAPALFGAVTVFMGNPPWATVVHKLLAATLLAVLAACTVRAGGLGGARALVQRATPKAVRGASIAAALALAAVLMGAMTAKIQGAAVACTGFPLCGPGSLGGGAQHVQLTHRLIAYGVAFHVLALFFVFSKRREAAVVVSAAQVALAVVLLQIALGAAMVLGGFPPVLRSLHQATGMALWLTTFSMAYLARVASAGARDAARATRSDARVPSPAGPVAPSEAGR